MKNKAPRIMIVAGEASGDLLGADLLRSLKKINANITFVGVGGASMQKQGLKSAFPMSDLSVMGIVEVVPQLPKILKHFDTLLTMAQAEKIDALITIDSPDFSFRLAKKIKREMPDLPCLHYVSPHVWAWRRGRIAKMAKFLDHVLALFPFEPEVYQESGLKCSYVGHPVGQRLADFAPTSAKKPLQKIKRIALCPGSRISEVSRLMPVLAETAELLKSQHTSIEFILPMAEGLNPRLFESYMHLPIKYIKPAERFEALKSCDAAIATSGTLNLEIAMLGLPMVVVYKLSPITFRLAKWLVKIKHFSPVNLVAEGRVVPELMQDEVSAENIAGHINQLLRDGEERGAQLKALDVVRHTIMSVDGKAPSDKAAEIIATYL